MEGKQTLSEYLRDYIEETEHQGVEATSEKEWEVAKNILEDFVTFVYKCEEA